jgi:ribosomal protein S4E
MKPTDKQHDDFLAHRPIPGLVFEHNDAVDVIGGQHVGDSGSIVSVEALGDDPTYLVELNSGKDAQIRQSLLRSVDM